MNRYGYPTVRNRSSYSLSVDLGEFSAMLAEQGFSERAIEQELDLLKEYRQRFKLDDPVEFDIEEAALRDEFVAAVERRRKRLGTKESSEVREIRESGPEL